MCIWYPTKMKYIHPRRQVVDVMKTMLIIFPVLSSSLGEVTRFMNETIIEAPKAEAFVNLTHSLPDYGSTCGVNFCSGSSAHVSIQFRFV